MHRASTALVHQDFPTECRTRNLEALVGNKPNNPTAKLAATDKIGDLKLKYFKIKPCKWFMKDFFKTVRSS